MTPSLPLKFECANYLFPIRSISFTIHVPEEYCFVFFFFFFAKILGGNYVFCCSSHNSFIPTSQYEYRQSKLKFTIHLIINKIGSKKGLWETRKKWINFLVAIFYYPFVTAQLNFALTMIVILQYYIEEQSKLQLHLLAERSGKKKKRSCWVKKGRTSEWWNKFVNNEVTESDWKEHFHMSSSNLKELCNILKPQENHKNESTNLCGKCCSFISALHLWQRTI